MWTHLKHAAILIILSFGSFSFYNTIIVIAAIGADRYLNHFDKIMTRAAPVIGGQSQMQRQMNPRDKCKNQRARAAFLRSLSLSLWCTEAHYICIAFQVDSAIKSTIIINQF